ncbi:MAG: TrkH family potassium uptake protein [Flavobacteriaceae bacterium]|nr:TrkH family potassium uptake protein [Flavobacteriaceae bacterium]MDH3795445.1 TrkH family potassium uptake protein [Flavobacteriaceae bacterium]
MINTGVVINVIGVLLIMLGGFMLTSLFFSTYYGSEDNLPILYSAVTTVSTGGLLWLLSRNSSKKIGKREGFLIVALGWCSVAIFSALPYLYSGVLPNLSNAFFESVSGLTTTGATVIQDIESVPQGILFWRSLTQWIGGMGIIVLTVAIFPLLGIGGVELFVAEAPGPTSDKIHPRIKETAKRLWYIYLGLTSMLIVLLFLNGMTFYDAFNHGLTTMATGGFSTKNASIAYFSEPAIQYILAAFMFIAGINYTLIYYGFKGRFTRIWKSDEFKTYLSLVIGLILIVTTAVYYFRGGEFERAFREATFQIISIITTTGYVSADYTAWTPVLTLLFFLLFFIGACAGSTSGGIKIIRHLVIFKNSFLELRRLLHPKAIIRIKIDRKIVAPRVITHIQVFLLFYLILFALGSLVMTVILNDFEQPFLTSIGAVATSLGNVGPAIGQLGPMDTFAQVPIAGKWVLTILMLLGRLELFTILILFTPYFWKRN